MNLDSDILLWINGHHAAWLDEVMWTASQAKTWLWLYIALVILLIKRYRSWKPVLLAVAAIGVAVGLSDWICSGVLKEAVGRLRPTHEPGIDPVHLVKGYTGGLYGFCSSHAANTMSVALLFSLIYQDSRATVGLMTWVALNCYSRMYLGVHYPTDIVCGLVIGALWAWVLWQALSRSHLLACAAVRQGGS